MSAYAKLPAGDDEESVVRESKVDEALGKAERIADRLGSGLGGGLRDASRALVAAGGDVEGLVEDADLPSIEPDDALRTLARRLDREADLWRGLAFSELKSVRLTDRVLQMGGAAFAASTMILALFAGLGAMLGGGGALLIGTGAGALAVGALLFVGVALVLRRNQRDTLRAALGRADLAELRLHRVAVAMAARAAEPERAGEILVRLERDVRG